MKRMTIIPVTIRSLAETSPSSFTYNTARVYYTRTRIIIIFCRSHNIVMLLYARAANITETDRRSNVIISEIPFDSPYIIIATGAHGFQRKTHFLFLFFFPYFSTAFPGTFLVGLRFLRPGKRCSGGPLFSDGGKYALADPFL